MEKFITFPDGSNAFITGCKDDTGCEHQWDGEGLITFGNGEVFKESEYKNVFENSEHYIAHFHNGKGSSMGECTCSKCGIPYTAVNNPYYL
jgi:hypothetical protein